MLSRFVFTKTFMKWCHIIPKYPYVHSQEVMELHVSPGRWDSEPSSSLWINSDKPVKAYFSHCWGVRVSGIQYIRRLFFFSLIKFRTSGGASQVAVVVKNLSTNAEDIRKCRFNPWIGKIPWRATSSSILAWKKNPMDRGAWKAIVHRVAKSQTQLRQLSTHRAVVAGIR